MNAIIFALIGAAFLFAASPAKTQTITTEETVTRTVTVTVPATPEGASQCRIIGRVVGLDPHGDNFLSVRLRANGPAGPAGEVDQLFTNNRVCVVGSSGRWLNVRYERNGRMFSGWVYDRYIAED